MVEFFRFDQCKFKLFKIKLPFSQQKHLQIFATSLTKWSMCASLQFRVRERSEKYLLLTVWCRELSRPGTQLFSIWETWIYTQNLLICNYDQHIRFGFIKLFICSPRINWQNQFLLFRGNCFLFASNTHHKFFVIKISSLHWNATAYTCKEKLWHKVAVECQISILLKRGWFSYVRVFLKRDKYHIYMAQLSLQFL